MGAKRFFSRCARLIVGLGLMVAVAGAGAGEASAENDWDSELWAEIADTCGENPICVYGYFANGAVMTQLVKDAVTWINERTGEFQATSHYASELELEEKNASKRPPFAFGPVKLREGQDAR